MRAYCVSTARVFIIFFCSLSLLFPCIVFRGEGINIWWSFDPFDFPSKHKIYTANGQDLLLFISLTEKRCFPPAKLTKPKVAAIFFFSLWLFFTMPHRDVYTSQLDGITCHPISGFCKRKCFLISVFALRVTHCRAEWSCEQSQLWPRPFEWKERDVKVMSIHLQFEIRRDGMELWRWKEEEDLGFKGFFVYMYSLMDFSSFFSSFFLLLLLLLF